MSQSIISWLFELGMIKLGQTWSGSLDFHSNWIFLGILTIGSVWLALIRVKKNNQMTYLITNETMQFHFVISIKWTSINNFSMHISLHAHFHSWWKSIGNNKSILTQNIDKNITWVWLSNTIISCATIVSDGMTVHMHHLQNAVRHILFAIGHNIVLDVTHGREEQKQKLVRVIMNWKKRTVKNSYFLLFYDLLLLRR